MEPAPTTAERLRELRVSVLPALVRRPALIPTALRQAIVLAPRGWWRHWPPIPLPAHDYLAFRSVTAYGGDGSAPPDPADVDAWLTWVRSWDAVTGGKPHPVETAPDRTRVGN